jgi:hypothetical protein
MIRDCEIDPERNSEVNVAGEHSRILVFVRDRFLVYVHTKTDLIASQVIRLVAAYALV